MKILFLAQHCILPAAIILLWLSLEKMLTRGHLIIIKRDGKDGSLYPVTTPTCSVGRGIHSDIRILLQSVSQEHCKIYTSESHPVRWYKDRKKATAVMCFHIRVASIMLFKGCSFCKFWLIWHFETGAALYWSFLALFTVCGLRYSVNLFSLYNLLC
jgi:hypothetical protein